VSVPDVATPAPGPRDGADVSVYLTGRAGTVQDLPGLVRPGVPVLRTDPVPAVDPWCLNGLSRGLARVAAGQFGLFTRAQAGACGYSGYQVRRRLTEGRWVAVCGPVLAVAGVALSTDRLDRAAALAVPAGVLAGPSAARAHRIPVLDLGPYLIVDAPGRHTPAGVRIWRTGLPDCDRCVVGGLAATSAARTVVDCVRILPTGRAVALLDVALHLGWITWPDFTGRASTYTGQPGAQRLVALAGVLGPGPPMRPLTARSTSMINNAETPARWPIVRVPSGGCPVTLAR